MSAETFTTNSEWYGRSKNSKIMSFNGWARFHPMSIVTRVTPGTVDVRIIIITLFQEDNIFGTNASLTYGP